MKLDLEMQVVSEPTLQDSTEVVPADLLFVPAFQPDFVETFQQIIDGLPEQIALVDESWTILVVNPAWTKTAASYGFDGVLPGCNYLHFCEWKATEGNTPAQLVVDGIRGMERSGETSFRFTYNGREKWAGSAFQLCVNRLEVEGRRFATVTRYDVTELVQLRLMREGFSHSLIEHQAEERRRIAREIHDSTMQLLAGLGLSLGQLKDSKRARVTGDIVSEMEGLLGEAQRELRAISFLAHPPMVSEIGLTQALRQLAGGFARRTGLNIATNAEADVTVSPAVQMAIFRMVQEALSNVHRHARATDVAVGIYQRRSVLHVAIADNGSGMPEKFRSGVGLSSMRERVEEIGGRMMVRRGNPGTILIASVPMDAEIRSVGDLAQAS
jgi:signal transduction histidine kinase